MFKTGNITWPVFYTTRERACVFDKNVLIEILRKRVLPNIIITIWFTLRLRISFIRVCRQVPRGPDLTRNALHNNIIMA
jgi:hypothetical protein